MFTLMKPLDRFLDLLQQYGSHYFDHMLEQTEGNTDETTTKALARTRDRLLKDREFGPLVRTENNKQTGYFLNLLQQYATFYYDHMLEAMQGRNTRATVDALARARERLIKEFGPRASAENEEQTGLGADGRRKLSTTERRVLLLRGSIEKIRLAALGNYDLAFVRTLCKEALAEDELLSKEVDETGPLTASQAEESTQNLKSPSIRATPAAQEQASGTSASLGAVIRCPGYGHPDCWMEEGGYCAVCAAPDSVTVSQQDSPSAVQSSTNAEEITSVKFTAIFTVPVGNYGGNYPNMVRFEQRPGESIKDALNRAGYEKQKKGEEWDISESTVFIFEGWPALEGEDKIKR